MHGVWMDVYLTDLVPSSSCAFDSPDALQGMAVGGKRVLRIPPNLAYGDQWYKGTIPPKSHIEFDIELLQAADSTTEELQMKLEDFGVGRLAGLIVCTAFLAVSSFL